MVVSVVVVDDGDLRAHGFGWIAGRRLIGSAPMRCCRLLLAAGAPAGRIFRLRRPACRNSSLDIHGFQFSVWFFFFFHLLL